VLDGVEGMADAAGSPLRPGVKPSGWAFANPLAPSVVTPAVQARWPALPAGAPAAKEMAAYWEVCLDTTPMEDLLRFDLLVLPLPGGASAVFPPAAREYRGHRDGRGRGTPACAPVVRSGDDGRK